MTAAIRKERIWTVPNVVCGARLLGVLPLLWAAWEGHRQVFLWILVALLASDWLDGKLASVLEQGTELGARLDSVVDAVMYAAVGLSFWWMEGMVIRAHAPWFLAVALSWGLSAVSGLVRFGRLPSYHSWGAKISWLVVSLTTLDLLLTGSSRAVPWALALVVLTNLEAVAIGLALPRWRPDVPTLWHALRIPDDGDEATDDARHPDDEGRERS